MSESESSGDVPSPGDTSTTSDGGGGGGIGSYFNGKGIPDVGSYMEAVDVSPKALLGRLSNTKPEVDIEELSAEYGSQRRAHLVAFVRKFLGVDGMPAIAHLFLALLPRPGGGA